MAGCIGVDNVLRRGGERFERRSKLLPIVRAIDRVSGVNLVQRRIQGSPAQGVTLAALFKYDRTMLRYGNVKRHGLGGRVCEPFAYLDLFVTNFRVAPTRRR